MPTPKALTLIENDQEMRDFRSALQLAHQGAAAARDAARTARDDAEQAAADIGAIGGIDGTVQATGDLPAASNHTGEFWFVVDRHDYYQSDGSAWGKQDVLIGNPQLEGDIVGMAGGAADAFRVSDYSTPEDAIGDALSTTSANGGGFAIIPEQLLPYDASAVSFPTDVLVVRQNHVRPVADVAAYGASGDGQVDDHPSFQGAVDVARASDLPTRTVWLPHVDASYRIATAPAADSDTDLRVVGAEGRVPLKLDGVTFEVSPANKTSLTIDLVARGDRVISVGDASKVTKGQQLLLSSDEEATSSPWSRDAADSLIIDEVDETNNTITVSHAVAWDFDPNNYSVTAQVFDRGLVEFRNVDVQVTGQGTFGSGINVKGGIQRWDNVTLNDLDGERVNSSISIFHCIGGVFTNFHVEDVVYGIWLRGGRDNTVDGVSAERCRHAVVNGALTRNNTIQNGVAHNCVSGFDCHASFNCRFENIHDEDGGVSHLRGLGVECVDVTVTNSDEGDGTPDMAGITLGPNYNHEQEFDCLLEDYRVERGDADMTIKPARGGLLQLRDVTFRDVGFFVQDGFEKMRGSGVKSLGKEYVISWAGESRWVNCIFDREKAATFLYDGKKSRFNFFVACQFKNAEYLLDNLGGQVSGGKAWRHLHFVGCEFENITSWANSNNLNGNIPAMSFVGCRFGTNTSFGDVGFDNPPPSELQDAFVSSIGNVGAGNKLKKRDRLTVTIASGNTQKNAYHSLNYAPSLASISVTPTSSLGAATTFWVSNVTSNAIVVSVDADPGQDVTFAIQVDATN
jgi:hypothetical protein